MQKKYYFKGMIFCKNKLYGLRFFCFRLEILSFFFDW